MGHFRVVEIRQRVVVYSGCYCGASVFRKSTDSERKHWCLLLARGSSKRKLFTKSFLDVAELKVVMLGQR